MVFDLIIQFFSILKYIIRFTVNRVKFAYDKSPFLWFVDLFCVKTKIFKFVCVKTRTRNEFGVLFFAQGLNLSRAGIEPAMKFGLLLVCFCPGVEPEPRGNLTRVEFGARTRNLYWLVDRGIWTRVEFALILPRIWTWGCAGFEPALNFFGWLAGFEPALNLLPRIWTWGPGFEPGVRTLGLALNVCARGQLLSHSPGKTRARGFYQGVVNLPPTKIRRGLSNIFSQKVEPSSL